MGLREKQKATRRIAILNAAQSLFVEQGYDQTKAEQIAEVAAVSLATLYNYFESKGEILLTLLTQENEQILERVEALEIPYDDGLQAVLEQVFGCYNSPEIILLNRDLWRLGFALSFSDVSSRGGACPARDRPNPL